MNKWTTLPPTHGSLEWTQQSASLGSNRRERMGWDKAHIQKNRAITVSYRKASRLPPGTLLGASTSPTMALTLLAGTWHVTAGQLGGTFGNRTRENMRLIV